MQLIRGVGFFWKQSFEIFTWCCLARSIYFESLVEKFLITLLQLMELKLFCHSLKIVCEKCFVCSEQNLNETSSNKTRNKRKILIRLIYLFSKNLTNGFFILSYTIINMILIVIIKKLRNLFLSVHYIIYHIGALKFIARD
jgi:hypothetical protein